MPEGNMNKRLAIVLIGHGLFVSGCAFNRTVAPLQPFTAAPGDQPTGVLVTNFFEGKHQVSETGSGSIVKLRESMEIRDKSLELASEISRAGMQSRALSDATQNALSPGELLLQGTFQRTQSGGMDTGAVPAALMVALTIGVVGFMLPYPYPFEYYCGYEYSVRGTDAQGHVRLATEGSMKIYYSSLNVVGLLGGVCEEEETANRTELRTALARKIVESLRPSHSIAASGATTSR
jgi:hypothetical protein